MKMNKDFYLFIRKHLRDFIIWQFKTMIHDLVFLNLTEKLFIIINCKV